MMDLMSKQKSQGRGENMTIDCFPLLSSGESSNSISLSIDNFEDILTTTINQNHKQSTISNNNNNIGMKNDDTGKDVRNSPQTQNNSLSQDSSKNRLIQESQQQTFFDSNLISFLFKQNEICNGIGNANDISNDETLKQLNFLQNKNESQSSVPVEQQFIGECGLSKDIEQHTDNYNNNNNNNNSNILSPEDIILPKTIIENYSKQKNQEEEVFNAFAANVQLQSYFIQMMQAVMTNMGQDININTIPLLQQSNIISQQTLPKEMPNEVVKKFQNNCNNNQISGKKVVDDDEPLDLSNKNNSIKSVSIKNEIPNIGNDDKNDTINNNVINDTLRLQEHLLQNGALSLLPYAFQSQIINNSSSTNTTTSTTTTPSNKWSSPRGAANRRTYTQADLEAAVNDIRSGKLGTRRASVVYGIPRSTLRNKIYKLESSTANPADILIIGKKKKKVMEDGGKEREDTKTLYKSMTEPEIHLSKLFNTNESVNVANEMINKSPKNEESSSLSCVGDILGLNSNIQRQSSSSMLSIGLQQKEENEGRMLSRENSFNKVYFGEGNTSRNSSENGDNSTSDGLKKSRPKRGQYRKYDKDALDEAVKSVRRGEMSVHRAGSFFGVPHSTLEYKVKERNLLRIKKRQKSFEEYNMEEKEALLVKEKNNTLSKNQQPSNVLTTLVTSWNMLSQNSENMLASIASKSSINE